MGNIEKTIAIIVPSLKTGGMERVATVLANYYSQQNYLRIHLITFGDQGVAYEVESNVNVHQPNINLAHLTFFRALFKGSKHLRSILHEIKPNSILSFGDRYNSFVILNSIGLRAKVFVSNRMSPTMSNGWRIDVLNKILYPFSSGIIAQTEYARKVFLKRYKNKNIVAIPNPFMVTKVENDKRENTILNVGRFSDQKNQHLLVRYFNELKTDNWELIFLGGGTKREDTINEINNLKPGKNVSLLGSVKDVLPFYRKSSIFAFTSATEGFPNVLGEAMAAGCACISFDCITGPSELIDDGINGFLIPLGDHDQYKQKLKLLMEDEELRRRFGKAARKKIEQKFNIEKVAKQYLKFIAE